MSLPRAILLWIWVSVVFSQSYNKRLPRMHE
jgi:hypothetical protein